MISTLLSRIVILLLGTLYPAYASYKAVRTKDVKEYVKWMMYWIVFALFTTAETITDVFLAFWFPFYYEIKIIVVLWLLSPATQGSSILYRKFVHPILVKKEQEIDEYLSRATEQGYKTVVELGARGVQYATQVIMQTAIKGGGGLVNQLKKSYSVGDLHADQPTRRGSGGNRRAIMQDESDAPASNVIRVHHPTHLASLPDVSDSEVDDFNDPISEPVMRPPMHRAPRTARVMREVYFTEIDSLSTARLHAADGETDHYIGQVRSVEDISSGYSSTEFLASDPNVGVDGAAGTIPRRSGSIRAARSATRPVTVVLEGANTKGKPASDVPSYATLPRQKKRTTKSTSTTATKK